MKLNNHRWAPPSPAPPLRRRREKPDEKKKKGVLKASAPDAANTGSVFQDHDVVCAASSGDPVPGPPSRRG